MLTITPGCNCPSCTVAQQKLLELMGMGMNGCVPQRPQSRPDPRQPEKSADDAEFIVAEVSKTWPEKPEDGNDIVSQRFQLVIQRNLRRGYSLHSWSLSTGYANNHVVETIVAVFRKVPKESPAAPAAEAAASPLPKSAPCA